MTEQGRFPQTHIELGDHIGSIYPALELPAYEFENMTLRVNDVVWGECEIGNEPYDKLLLQLARHPLFRRLQAVEQLTLPPDLSVIPNTSRFSRWQHIWGSLIFVRKMTGHDDRFSSRDRIVAQLRTLFSDVGQTAFSHLGDWVFQGVNNGENLHDEELMDLLRSQGIDEMLNEVDLTLDETVFPDVEDWVECPSPGLCVDRVDYGMREILRWVHPSIDFEQYRHQLANPKELFQIDDNGMLQITDSDFARKFAGAYNVLGTEDWGHPIQRLQTDLLQVAVKRALLGGYISEGVQLDWPVHPRDRLYGIDSDFRFAFHDSTGVQLHRLMERIAQDQRSAFVHARRHDLNSTLGHLNTDTDVFQFPEPFVSYSEQSRNFGLLPLSVKLEALGDGDATAFAIASNGLQVAIPRKKHRYIDPQVAGEPLSGISPRFSAFLNAQGDAMAQQYMASILVNPEFASKVYEIKTSVDERWPDAIARLRSPENLETIINQASLYGAGNRFDAITEI